MSWENFIKTKILQPLSMTETYPSFNLVQSKNFIDPHAPVDGKVQVIRRDWSTTANSAGGIYSNVHDMCKWIIMQMNNGKYGTNMEKSLFSEAVHNDMWAQQTIIPATPTAPYNTHFAGYGLGWGLSDVGGYKQVTHTGGLAGIVTQVLLIPELKLGIIVFTNQQSGAAFYAISNTIKDSYIGVPRTDWVDFYKKRVDGNEADAKNITDEIWKDINAQKSETSTININDFAGTYIDPWFGDVMISMKNGKLWFDSKRSYLLTGEMLYYKANTFVVKWDNRSFDADAYVMFDLDKDGKPSGMTMKAISPLTDFSFDFHDLNFVRADSTKK